MESFFIQLAAVFILWTWCISAVFSFISFEKLLFDPFKTLSTFHFGPRVYPRGSYVITHVRPWSVVCGPSVGQSLDISETDLRIFLIFLHEVSAPQGYTSDRARLLKISLGGRKWGKISLFGAFLMFFVHISKTALTILM